MATCHKAHLSPAINHVNNQWISSSIRFFSFFKKTLGWGADQIFICSLFELILMKLSEHTLWFRSHQSKASQMIKKVYNTTAFWEVFLLRKDKSAISEYSPVFRFSAFGWKSIETGGRPNFDLCPCWAYFDEVKWIYLVIPILSIKGEPDGQEGLQHRCLLGRLSPAQKQVNNQWMFSSTLIFSFWLEKH